MHNLKLLSLGEAPKPSFMHLFRYDKRLTIAKPGHYERPDKVQELLPPNVVLAGDYFSQAGVEAAVYSGERTANELLASQGSRPVKAA